MAYRMLVPLDGSPLAEAILPHVRRLAKEAPLEVHLLGVATLPSATGFAVALFPSLRFGGAGAELQQVYEEARGTLGAYLQEQAAELRAEGMRVSTELRSGEPSDEIVRCAAEREVDAIAMTTHGRTGLEQVLQGSVAESVLRQAGRPVHLLRPAHEAFARAKPDGAPN